MPGHACARFRHALLRLGGEAPAKLHCDNSEPPVAPLDILRQAEIYFGLRIRFFKKSKSFCGGFHIKIGVTSLDNHHFFTPNNKQIVKGAPFKNQKFSRYTQTPYFKSGSTAPLKFKLI